MKVHLKWQSYQRLESTFRVLIEQIYFQDGTLRAGDRILRVDWHDALHASYDSVLEWLRSARHQVGHLHRSQLNITHYKALPHGLPVAAMMQLKSKLIYSKFCHPSRNYLVLKQDNFIKLQFSNKRIPNFEKLINLSVHAITVEFGARWAVKCAKK